LHQGIGIVTLAPGSNSRAIHAIVCLVNLTLMLMKNLILKLNAFTCRSLCFALVLYLSSFNSYGQQGGITRIYTDFNGYWTSASGAISPIKPDNSHNVLAFTWNGSTYSTGVNDATLATHGVTFIPKNFQAFPVRNVTINGTSALPAFGQLKDGVDNGPSVPPPFTIPANITAFLTDGVRGLDIGTGVANVPTGTLIFDFGSIIAPSQIGDGIPDILVSQIADPSAVLDSVYFTDGAGNLVGNRIAINHNTTPSVGTWTADFYNANGTLNSGYTKTDRSIRVWAADISAFGISAANYSPALSFRYKLNGSSDPAFLAFNTDIIQVVSANDDVVNTAINVPAVINVLANDQPVAGLNISSLQITTAPAHGSATVDPETGLVTYTPVAGYSGIDHFVYQVCNNNNVTPQCDDATVTINVGTADLNVTKTVNIASPPVASKVIFTVTAKNAGINDDYGVKINDLLPSGYTYVSAVPGVGSYNNSTGVWTIGNLSNGSSAVLTVTALVNASGNYTNTAVISGTLFDPVSADNTATVATVPVAASSVIQISKSVDYTTATAGTNVVFTLTVANNGPSNNTGITVHDILPTGYTYVSATVPAGTTYNNGTGIWNIGSLASGAGSTLTITATVKATGSYANTAAISGTNADPVPGNNSATATVDPSVGIPVFTLGAVSVRCQSASAITYTATATNTTGIGYSLLPASAGTIDGSTGAVIWDAAFSGTATITASAAGTNGPATADHTVTVNPAAALPSFALGNTSARCQAAGAITYNATAVNSTAIVYSLSPLSTGSINSSTGEVNWDASFSGTAIITATTSGCNGLFSADHTVTVHPVLAASIAYDGSPYCATGIASVNLSGQGGGLFSAGSGLALDPSTGSINLATSTPDSYTVNYTFDPQGCSNPVTATVVINKTTVTVTDPQPECAPATIDLTAPGITAGSGSGLAFSYYSDPAGSTVLSNPAAIDVSNTYYIQGKNTATGCVSGLYPVTVKINSKPSISASSSATDICKGSPVTLSASSPGNDIEWVDQGAGNSVTVNPLVTTTYTGIAMSPAGCPDTAILTINVKEFSVTLTASPDRLLAGKTVMLNSSANFNYGVISWMPENLFVDQSATSQSFIVSDTSKTFGIIARSDEGCLDTAYTSITVNTNTGDFFIPNAFTPNNDGQNDVFKAFGSSIKQINLQVFNQWGQLLFETKDPQRGWDGNYGGHPQATGVYLYAVKLIFYDNTVYTGKGTINLIR
jgi:gliding motility-associated-like protein/uncharacterized repeat protein (TIGR01451 family)